MKAFMSSSDLGSKCFDGALFAAALCGLAGVADTGKNGKDQA